jgi:hypothetical protein
MSDILRRHTEGEKETKPVATNLQLTSFVRKEIHMEGWKEFQGP